MKKRRLTMDQAIEFINKLRGVEGVNWVSPATIYKYTYNKKIKNYGTGNKGLWDPEELEAVFGEKSA